MAAVWAEGANAIGDAVHSGAEGQVLSSALVDDKTVGQQIFTGALNDYQPVFLTIAP